MNHHPLSALGRAIALVLGCVGPLAGQSTTVADSSTHHLDVLVGEWHAQGSGFSSRLSYEWILPGRLLAAKNEVLDGSGRVIAKYAGVYARDPVTTHWDVRVVAQGGELHRGVARWRDGVFWHEAEIVGGSTTGYASAIRLAGDTIQYFARYTPGPANAALLETAPLVYVRRTATPIRDRPLRSRP